jgi:uncharacterized membrane protein YkgB
VVSAHFGPIPVLSGLPGQFLLKDLMLIGVAVWSLGEALQAGAVPARALVGAG